MKNFIIILILVPWRIDAQIITTFAGTGSGTYSGDGGPATAAGVPWPAGGVFDKYGSYYFAGQSNRVRKIDTSFIIWDFAGDGSGSFDGDGVLATSVDLQFPEPVRIDTNGNFFFAESDNNKVRKINASTNIITTVAGTGTGSYSGDGGMATNATIWDPQDVCFDKFGNMYISDGFNYRVRKVSPSGVITTFAGNGGYGYDGEGTIADTSTIGFPAGLCSDIYGNVYLASEDVCRIMKIDTAGIMTTFAGTGSCSYTAEGIPATAASFAPIFLTMDMYNDMFICDRYNNMIYEVDTTGILRVVAGNGVAGDSGDGGPATAASLYQPAGVALDACGNLYIPTLGSSSISGTGRRIRKVTYPPILTIPSIALTGTSTASAGTTVTVNATVTNAGSSYIIYWYNDGIEFTTTTTPVVTYTKGAGTDTITALIVPTGYGCYDSSTSAPHIVTDESLSISSTCNGVFNAMVYPNPAHNELTIITPGNTGEVTIANMPGQLMLSGEIKNKRSTIGIEMLPAGMYLLKLTDNTGSTTVTRFVKQ